jgi:hypothetical protein
MQIRFHLWPFAVRWVPFLAHISVSHCQISLSPGSPVVPHTNIIVGLSFKGLHVVLGWLHTQLFCRRWNKQEWLRAWKKRKKTKLRSENSYGLKLYCLCKIDFWLVVRIICLIHVCYEQTWCAIVGILPDVVAEWLEFKLLLILEVPGLNIVPETGYSSSCYPWLSSVPRDECRHSTAISHIFAVHAPLIL